jgi:chromosomal replication initiation ATPase DnaA
MSSAHIQCPRAKHRKGFGAPQRPPQLDALETAVAAAFAISPSALRAPTRRSAPTALARQAAMYLAHVAFGLSLTEVGEVFGRDRSTAAHACRLMESRRDDPHMDTLLIRLEHACATLTSGRSANELCR